MFALTKIKIEIEKKVWPSDFIGITSFSKKKNL